MGAQIGAQILALMGAQRGSIMGAKIEAKKMPKRVSIGSQNGGQQLEQIWDS